MPVTSNSLFHFTDSREKLEGILNERFRITYCKESFTLGEHPIETIFIPMISFCDIPLSQIKDHIEKYGGYGIGISKTWGIKNKLNPVLYLESNSYISSEIIEQMADLVSMSKSSEILISSLTDKSISSATTTKGPANPMDELYFPTLANTVSETTQQGINAIRAQNQKILDSHLNLFRYIKNYQGDLERGGKTFKNYRFYDEREWRFIPSEKESGIEPFFTEKQFQSYRGTGKKSFVGQPLDFTSSDIKYLIVKKESDISPLINALKEVGGLCKKPRDFDLLVTKILTVDSLNMVYPISWTK